MQLHHGMVGNQTRDLQISILESDALTTLPYFCPTDTTRVFGTLCEQRDLPRTAAGRATPGKPPGHPPRKRPAPTGGPSTGGTPAAAFRA
ncbi:hypothetical protein ElyMa_001834300 [Elysia marginata]|uniref:Uncharacterized protein n=1 Tax=Elysia marginata TaxID=1093978 RepID=A0AAV4EJ69_9GAST|nr:hypothetical protein ElyMa_001834300 [Elysia marginata]